MLEWAQTRRLSLGENRHSLSAYAVELHGVGSALRLHHFLESGHVRDVQHYGKFDSSIFPVGQAWDLEVHEFDFRDNGGVIYDKDGVTVRHWERSHAKDGASGYRLDWNGLSVVWTSDGRPNRNDIEWAKGCDVYITETQASLMSISSGVAGVPPVIGRFTIDAHHTPAYAAGYMPA